MPAQVTATHEDIAACDARRAAVLGSLTGTGPGCEPGRETWRAIRAAGFREVHARWYPRRAPLGIYRPCLGGVAHV